VIGDASDLVVQVIVPVINCLAMCVWQWQHSGNDMSCKWHRNCSVSLLQSGQHVLRLFHDGCQLFKSVAWTSSMCKRHRILRQVHPPFGICAGRFAHGLQSLGFGNGMLEVRHALHPDGHSIWSLHSHNMQQPPKYDIEAGKCSGKHTEVTLDRP
jgi:hypothetical protein